ncbi:hypothetical protein DMB44_04170 [Thermoplasma sp. Kam2015]|uniref:hypothetical protein n=1 Tax=Thermoplasma sp. Kam2015 TaxID=2094122 RepID=UPI000D8825F0|nr:hypothetical protein [Thermoplasma sp. Kam2015]PYB68536.1 hypothetical protein DMB44_04170 [Thermoplasma sp. Kam2015]
MDEENFEKTISEFIGSGYQVMKIYADGSVGFFMNTTDKSKEEFLDKLEPALIVTMRELEEYKEHYNMSWDEVPEYFAQDTINDEEPLPCFDPEDWGKIERAAYDWIYEIDEPFEGKWAVLVDDDNPGKVEFEQLPTASRWDLTGWTQVGTIEGLGLDGIELSLIDPCTGKTVIHEVGDFNIRYPGETDL